MNVAQSAPQRERVVFVAPLHSGFHGHAFKTVLSSSVRNPTSSTCLQRSIIAVLFKLSERIVNALSVDVFKQSQSIPGIRTGISFLSIYEKRDNEGYDLANALYTLKFPSYSSGPFSPELVPPHHVTSICHLSYTLGHR